MDNCLRTVIKAKTEAKKIYSFLAFFLLFIQQLSAQVTATRSVTLMGSRFDFTIVAKDNITAQQNIDTLIKEIDRIENLISDWRPNTQVSLINRNAGIQAIKVDKELFDLTKKALYFSKITDGAFDISYAAMDKIWKFDGSMKKMPSDEEIKASISKIGYQNIVLDSVNQTIFLRKKEMKISFGSIGKAYAADKGRTLMKKIGTQGGIVNAAGDITTWGNPRDNKTWKIGVNNPFDEEKNITILSVTNAAMTTSGTYEKFVEFNGKRYSHLINPKTGYPSTGLISVTVIGPNAETANGFSTSMMILGKDEGIKLIENFPEYLYILVTDDGQVLKSKNLKVRVKSRLKI